MDRGCAEVARPGPEALAAHRCWIFATVFVISAVVNAHASNSVPSSDCTKNPFLADRLGRDIQAIAAHGDLADVRFIEQTLGVKFKENIGSSDTTAKTSRTSYMAQELYGFPTFIELTVDTDKERNIEQQEIGRLFILLFGRSSCVKLYPYNIFSQIPGGPNAFERNNVIIHGGDLISAVQTPPSPGKDGSKISVIFSYSEKTEEIGDLSISQRP